MDFTPSRNEQLTEKKLNWGYWWVTHKIRVQKVATVVFGVFSFSLLAYGAYGFLDYYLITGPAERANLAEQGRAYIPYGALNRAQAPAPLSFGDIEVLKSGENRYDIATRVDNTDTRHWAEFNYRFRLSDDPNAVTREAHVFLLPGDSTFITALAVKAEFAPSPTLEEPRIYWHRVSDYGVGTDPEGWRSARLKLDIANTAFAPASPADPLRISRASFDVTNLSAFSFRNPRFVVALYDGARLVGLNDVVLTSLLAGEKKPVEATWLSELPSVSRVEVIPAINIFDKAAYIAPGR